MKLEEFSCCIHCWQHKTVAVLYHYNKSTVCLSNIEQFIMAKFAEKNIPLLSSIKLYFITSEENWAEKIKISDDENLRIYLETARLDTTNRIMVSIGSGSPDKSPLEAAADEMSSLSGSENNSSKGTGRVSSNSNRGSQQESFRTCVLTRDSSTCVFCRNNVQSFWV